jgi:SAM-dependent methyltransferase
MSLAYKISSFNRRRKYQIFQKELAPTSADKILDVGFSDQEYGPDDNFLEKNYPFPEKLTALGIDKAELFLKRYPAVKAVHYDGRQMPFADKEFDIVWSNAVIEHVGNREDQLLFLSEIARVGKKAFITTPNRYFPIEVHTRLPFVHWLPKKVFDRLVRFVGKDWAAGNYMNLLIKKEIILLLDAAEIKNYRLIGNHFLGFTLDFVILIN